MARITTPEVIGTSSAVISIAIIFSTIVAMGIPAGVQRFLGKSFAEKNFGETRGFVKASFLLITIAIIACTIAILVSQNLIYSSLKIDFSLVMISIFLMISFTTTQLLRSIVTSTLKTKMLPISMAISTVVKLGSSIVLVLVGMGAYGVTLGYTFFEIVASAILVPIIFVIFRNSTGLQSNLIISSKKVFEASVVSWIPALVYNIGSQIGTLVVLGLQGAGQAGVFFVAFAIFTAISGMMNSLVTVAFPKLSSMTDGRKIFTWRVTKMSLIIALPFSSSLIFYSKDIMGLFGHGFVLGSSTLEIMLFAMLPTGVWTGINTLMYSYGKYRQVLYLGLASNLSRTVLYFVLVPTYGSEGAALSFVVGAIIGFVVSIFYARRVGLLIFWKDLFLLFFVPLAISFAVYYVQIYFIAGILITIAVSYVILLKTRVIDRADLQDTVEVLPESVSRPLLRCFDKISKKLGRS